MDSLQVSAKELEDISNLTKEQGDVWLIQRKGLLTSTKLQAAYTRQTTLDKAPSKDERATASRLASDSLVEKYGTMPIQIQYGKVHENEARKHYKN